MSEDGVDTLPPSRSTAVPADWGDADAPRRRELIVEAALDLLHQQGLAAVTMRGVAARLGVGTMTLYTYVDGQGGLQREMVRCGFEMLNRCCTVSSTLDTGASSSQAWFGGARTYLRFALDHPNLYKLMFDHPLEGLEHDVLDGGFETLLERVTQQLKATGLVSDEALPREARRRAGRYWIALHGLATLAIAGRLCVLQGDLDSVLGDLLTGVAPT